MAPQDLGSAVEMVGHLTDWLLNVDRASLDALSNYIQLSDAKRAIIIKLEGENK